MKNNIENIVLITIIAVILGLWALQTKPEQEKYENVKEGYIPTFTGTTTIPLNIDYRLNERTEKPEPLPTIKFNQLEK
jgi:hypothetical protein